MGCAGYRRARLSPLRGLRGAGWLRLTKQAKLGLSARMNRPAPGPELRSRINRFRSERPPIPRRGHLRPTKCRLLPRLTPVRLPSRPSIIPRKPSVGGRSAQHADDPDGSNLRHAIGGMFRTGTAPAQHPVDPTPLGNLEASSSELGLGACAATNSDVAFNPIPRHGGGRKQRIDRRRP